MNFTEFENQARLHVIGALDHEEAAEFEAARQEFGERGDEFIEQCQILNAAFALSLRPEAPRYDAQERLMAMIRGTRWQQDRG